MCAQQVSLASLKDGKAQPPCSQANVERRTYQVISFLSESNNFPPFFFFVYRTLPQHSRPCLNFPFSVTRSQLPQAPCLALPSSLVTLWCYLSLTTCFVTFLFKASVHIFGRKVRWYNLFGEHFGNVYENDKPRAFEQYTNPSVRTFSCRFIHQVKQQDCYNKRMETI